MEIINIYTHGIEQQGLIETPEAHKIKEARRHKIYNQIQKEEIAIEKKQYREDNKERLAEYARIRGAIKVSCLNCGLCISNHCMTVHRRTKKCQSFIKE